jgi:hypothetical protein
MRCIAGGILKFFESLLAVHLSFCDSTSKYVPFPWRNRTHASHIGGSNGPVSECPLALVRQISLRQCIIYSMMVRTSVSDPDPLIPDPDPAFSTEHKSVSESRVLMTKNWKKFTAETNFLFLKSKFAI